ncbi:respiratory burst oxidase homolog protein E isoform X2 [Lotus japonicus]|uniref:respiratory burst oxidase homolog protein E isoform X2 n=1 Tax=Lotus japonicus TaxID=34305 RepID=UPI00258A3BAF|nr:respiratory burst oxidase homolog protein E isoform X2 [Lotus japonicus]
MRTSSFGRYSTGDIETDSPENLRTSSPPASEGHAPSHGYSSMLPVFLNDLRTNHHKELVEITLELEDDAVVLCNVAPASSGAGTSSSSSHATGDEGTSASGAGAVARSLSKNLSITSRIRRKFPWLRSMSMRTSASSTESVEDPVESARNARRMQAKLERTRSSAQRALKGLRFISKSGEAGEELWRKVEERFGSLAKDGLLAREDFGGCIGMDDSKEFAVGVFDALARRKGRKASKITKEELHHFWQQISDQSFDARLQIFFDMADSNEDGRITREEVQELIMLSASANKLSKLKEQAEGYAALIMEELDPENLGYIELWQLEMLLLQKDRYMNYSRQLSTSSVSWSQNMTGLKHKNEIQRLCRTLQCLALEYWRRGWVLFLWLVTTASLFAWKFYQYRNRTSFQVMGYCLPVAKGAAETLKLNMALILLPVCRNTLTWLRSTRARKIVPFDDNINFHKIIACAIVVGVVVHAGNHLACDFPLLINSSPEEFSLIASDFNNKKPTYKTLLTGVEGVTGISMVTLMAISFTLATHHFRRNAVRLPPPLNRLTGFNAFWYSHHLLGVVYILLFIHGSFLNLTHRWYNKTTWMYISVPLLLYIAERTLRTSRSKHYAVKIQKVSVLPGNVFSLIMSKPNGFKYKSGQYIFLQCPKISPFEWHPFSITSAPGDEYLSVHIRTVGDWTQELKLLFTEDDIPPVNCNATFGELVQMDQREHPRLFVDGPYGAPAQDFKNFDVLLLIGLGIGATPFISILRDLLNNTRASDESMDQSNTETTRSDESWNSFTSSNLTPGGNKRSQRTTNAYFYWVTREPGSFEWFKGVMDEVAEMDHRGQIELHNYLTSVYEEGDARSTLITMIQALNHAKHGVDILSGTRVRTHFARPNWREVFIKIASKHPYSTVGVFYCGMPVLAKELKKLSLELSHKTTTRFDFHKEYF